MAQHFVSLCWSVVLPGRRRSLVWRYRNPSLPIQFTCEEVGFLCPVKKVTKCGTLACLHKKLRPLDRPTGTPSWSRCSQDKK